MSKVAYIKPSRSSFVLIDVETGNKWANETFKDEAEIKSFCKQNKLKIVPQPKCPDCGTPVRMVSNINTDWYGNLKHYRCKACKETFVSQDGGELEIAAKH